MPDLPSAHINELERKTKHWLLQIRMLTTAHRESSPWILRCLIRGTVLPHTIVIGLTAVLLAAIRIFATMWR